MCLLILTSDDLDASTKTLLKRAYDKSLKQLAALPGISRDEIDSDELAKTLLDLFKSGQRDEARLTQWAVFNSVQNLIIGEEKRA